MQRESIHVSIYMQSISYLIMFLKEDDIFGLLWYKNYSKPTLILVRPNLQCLREPHCHNYFSPQTRSCIIGEK